MTIQDIGCLEAEIALLGCLLRLPADSVVDIVGNLEAGDLVDPRHRVILVAAAVVAGRGDDPDPVLVLGQLRRLGGETSFTADRGAGVYLADMYGAAGVPVNANAYLQVILEHAYRRRVVEAAQRLEQHAGTLCLNELEDLVAEQVSFLHSAAERLRHRRVTHSLAAT